MRAADNDPKLEKKIANWTFDDVHALVAATKGTKGRPVNVGKISRIADLLNSGLSRNKTAKEIFPKSTEPSKCLRNFYKLHKSEIETAIRRRKLAKSH
ncbi:MAG: hypothetical protein ACYDCG_18300 [Candidatus Acidiferrales bacterium]